MAITYATLNPADKEANVSLSWGNLTASYGWSTWWNVRSTIGKSSGKWYWEITIGTLGSSQMMWIATSWATLTNYPWSDALGYGYFTNNGNKYNNGAGVAYWATYTTGDKIGVALDMDTWTLTFYKNWVSQGTAYTGLSGTFYAILWLNASGSTSSVNFGASAFSYSVPSGYNPWLYSWTPDINSSIMFFLK